MHYRIYSQYHKMREKKCFFVFRALTASSGGGGGACPPGPPLGPALVIFIMLINVKMPTIVIILTFMSKTNKFRAELS